MADSKYIDAHCHLDLYPDYGAVVRDAEARSTGILAVTTTPYAYAGNLARAGSYASVTVCLGLHPQVVGTKHDDILLFDSLVHDADIIGEVGLDASPRYYKTFDEQQRVFAHITDRVARVGGRPMSVHAVRSVARVIEIVEEHDPEHLSQYAIHWFSGSASELRAAVSRGFYFSINIAMTRSKNWGSILSLLPPDRVITETDGPFIRDEGIALEPWRVRDVIDVLARSWALSHDGAAARVRENFALFMAR